MSHQDIAASCFDLDRRLMSAVDDWQKAQGGQVSIVMAATVALKVSTRLWKHCEVRGTLEAEVIKMMRLAMRDPEGLARRMVHLATSRIEVVDKDSAASAEA